eukprot:4325-Heterococcus_DN1.PRE.1
MQMQGYAPVDRVCLTARYLHMLNEQRAAAMLLQTRKHARAEIATAANATVCCNEKCCRATQCV